MSIHAIESVGLLYVEAIGLYSADGSEILKYYPYEEEVTPEKFINLLK